MTKSLNVNSTVKVKITKHDKQMLNQDQTHFILECIKHYMGGKSFSFTDGHGEVILYKEEINQLINDLKERKF